MAVFTVNGKTVTAEKNQKLLRFLRDELRLTSVKDGCSEGACGTCTVLIDGKPTKACIPQTDKLEGKTIVTNGDQTDTIAQFMNGNLFPGYSFEAALATRTYEDDAPNFTPRISGVVDMRRGGYKLSIVKSNEGNADSVQRQTYDYPQPVAGEGHFISTYVKNGAPIPSFAGEPLRVAIDTNDADKFAEKLWGSLNEDNKVSLFVRSIELETGTYEDLILNKYTAVEG